MPEVRNLFISTVTGLSLRKLIISFETRFEKLLRKGSNFWQNYDDDGVWLAVVWLGKLFMKIRRSFGGVVRGCWLRKSRNGNAAG